MKNIANLIGIVVGLTLVLPAGAAVIAQVDPIVEPPVDPEQEVLAVPMLDDDRLASFELTGFTYQEDKGLGFVTRIEGVDGCSFRATLWEFAPAVGMSRDRSCDWSTWVEENTRMVAAGQVLPIWELPAFLQGWYEDGHYDPDGGDSPPADNIPSLKDRVEEEVTNISECSLAQIAFTGSTLVCVGSTWAAFQFGGPTNPIGGSATVIAVGSCTLALGSLLAALHYCYGLPVDGVNLEGMTEYLETHDMFLDVVDVEDFMEFVDVEQIVLDNGVVR
ncbi:MAG: hypothetical protein QGH45_19120 [Myxococcota bacterium]|jgi:hypothetical protein|nr:hypothetical protein [Myxococcota bacterium]